MLEIIAVIALASYLSQKAAFKGHSRLWGALGPMMWVGFEFTGACMGAMLDLGLGVYLVAFAFAILGGALSALVVALLPDRSDEYFASFSTSEAGSLAR